MTTWSICLKKEKKEKETFKLNRSQREYRIDEAPEERFHFILKVHLNESFFFSANAQTKLKTITEMFHQFISIENWLMNLCQRIVNMRAL